MFTPDRFFVTGGTLRPDAPSYVERRADRELLDALLRGEFCYVLTSRQMGKSSLMVRTAARLRGSGQRVLLLDLTAVGQNLTPEQWYRSLLDLAADQLDLDFDPYWQAHRHHGPMLRFLGALQSTGEPLVVFIDEIDSVQSLPFSTDELFAGIREYYNRRAQQPPSHPLTFCLLGVAMPADLIRDPRATPFNIGRRIELTDFTPAEAAPLALGFAGMGVWECGSREVSKNPNPHTPTLPHLHTPTLPHSHTANRLLHRVLYWTGGHPYLTQRLCEAVSSQRNGTDLGAVGGWLRGRPETLVDQVAFELFFAPGARKRDPNLHLVHERLLRGNGDVAAILDLYRRVLQGIRVRDEATNQVAARLQLAGIVRSDGVHLQPRNRIYARSFDRRWISEHMPDAEERRQRAAFRQGLLRAGAVAAVVLSLVGGLAGVAAREAHEATQLTRQLSQTVSQREEALRKLGRAYADLRRERNRARGQAVRASRSEAREKRHRRNAETLRTRAQAASVLAEQGRRRALHLQAIAEQQRAENHERLVRISVANGMRLAEEGRPFDGLHWLAEALRLDRRKPERARAHRTRIASLLRQAPALRHAWNGDTRPAEVLVSADGTRMVAATLSGSVRVWDAQSGKQLGKTLDYGGRLLEASYSADGRRLLIANGDRFQVLDAESAAPLAPVKVLKEDLSCAKISPDGRRVLTGNRAGVARLWDAESGRLLVEQLPHETPIGCAAFSPDGRRLYTAEDRGLIHAWRLPDGAPLPFTFRAHAAPLCLSPNGRWLVAVQGTGALVFDTARERLQLSIPDQHLHSVKFSADSRRLITVTGGDARLWDLERSTQVGKRMHHEQFVLATAFNPSGTGVLTLTSDGTVSNWEASAAGPAIAATNLAGPAWRGTFDRTGERVLLARAQGLVQLWDLREAGPLLRSRRPITRTPLAVSENTRCILTEDADGQLSVLDMATGSPAGPPVATPPRLSAVALAPTGDRFAVARLGYGVRYYETATGKPAGEPAWPGENIRHLQFTPGGRLLGVSEQGSVFLWDAKTLRSLMPPIRTHRHDPPVAISADGEHVAVVQDRNHFLVRNLGAKPGERRLDQLDVVELDVSRDGSLLVTAGSDRRVQVWSTRTFEPLGAPIFHDSFVTWVKFSPDGRSLVVCGENQSARIWGCDGRPRTPVLRHTRGLASAAFSPEGSRLVTLTGEGQARLWDARTGEGLTVPTRIGHAGGTCRFSADGVQVLFALDDGEIHLWSPDAERRPAETVAQLATAITGQRLHATAGDEDVPAPQAAALWEKIRPPTPIARAAGPRHDADHSRHEAGRLEKAGAWPGAAAHLDRVIAVSPAELGLRLRRARARAEIGRYREAADDLAVALDLGENGYLIHYEYALLCLAAGDQEAYQAVCKRMLDRFSQGHVREMDMTAWTCSLGPNSPENLTRALALARALVPREPDSADYHHTLGVLLYRGGRYEEAAAPLREALRLRGEGESSLLYHLHLSLVLRQLGDFRQAEQLIRTTEQRRARSFQSSAELGKTWSDRVENELIAAELRTTAREKPGTPPSTAARPQPVIRPGK